MALGPTQLAILCRLADGPAEGLDAHYMLGAVALGTERRWLITATGRRAAEAQRAHEDWRARR